MSTNSRITDNREYELLTKDVTEQTQYIADVSEIKEDDHSTYFLVVQSSTVFYMNEGKALEFRTRIEIELDIEKKHDPAYHLLLANHVTTKVNTLLTSQYGMYKSFLSIRPISVSDVRDAIISPR